MLLRRFILWIVVGAFAFLFFVSVPQLPYGDTLPRFALFHSAVLVAAALWVLSWWQGEVTMRGYSRRFYAVAGAFVLFVATIFVLSLFQDAFWRQIFGGSREVLGVFSLFLSAVLTFVMATAFRESEWKKFRLAFLILSFGVALVGLGSAEGLFEGGDTVVRLPFGSPSDLLLVMLVAGGVAFSVWRDKSQRAVIVLPLLALFVLVGVVAAVSFADQYMIERPMVWSAAKAAFSERPWVGWGVADLSTGLYNGFDASTMVSDDVFELPLFTTSHSGFWAALVRGGIIGFASAAVLMTLLTIVGFKQRRHRAMLVVFLATLAFVAIAVAPSVLAIGLLSLFAAIFLAEPSGTAIGATHQRFPAAPSAVLGVGLAVALGFLLVSPIQVAMRIHAVGGAMTFINVAKTEEVLNPCRCSGGDDFRMALTEAVINGEAFSREEAVAALDFSLEEIRKVEESMPKNPLSFWRHQQLLNTKIAFVQADDTVSGKERGNRVLALGQEGIEVYERAIALAPNHPEAYIQRGILAFLRGFYLQADKDFFTKALVVMETNARARWSRGLARERYGYWSGARGDLVAATEELQFDYHNPRDFAFLVEVFSTNNDAKNAEAFVFQWVQEFPHDAEAHFEYAKLLEARGAMGRALLEYGEAYRLDPSLRAE